VRKVRFLAAAESDANEAVDYLNKQRDRLGNRLEEDLQETVNAVRDRPLSGKRIRENVRKFQLRTFRYNVIYIHGVDDDEIIIVAVAHHRRRSDYWLDRLKTLH
jgi:plasmid stabilization system protein ParE